MTSIFLPQKITDELLNDFLDRITIKQAQDHIRQVYGINISKVEAVCFVDEILSLKYYTKGFKQPFYFYKNYKKKTVACETLTERN